MNDLVMPDHSPQVGLDLLDLLDCINDILRKRFAEEPPYMSLPIVWTAEDGHGGSAVSDAAMLYISIPSVGKDGRPPFWKVSLEDVVRDQFETDHRYAHDEEFSAAAARFSARLREIADMLDAAMAARATPSI
jgi:hypothetical protein